MISKNYHQAQELYSSSVSLANSWISKHYPGNNQQTFGVSFEKIQAFSQHHFFSCLLEDKPIDDIWSQYPTTTVKPLRPHFLKRTLHVVKNFAEPKANIGSLDSSTQIVFLASGRHLEDWQSTVLYLRQHFKILIVGKIPSRIEKIFDQQKIPAINLSSARQFLTHQERFANLSFFLRFFWKRHGQYRLLNNPNWPKRLWYLRLEQFPEIAALLKISRRVFEKTQPALLLTTSSNDTFGASFALMAQKLNIPVAELQHGYTNVGTDVPFYNSDYQLVWGEIPQKVRKVYAKGAIVVGCPFLKKPAKETINRFKDNKIRVLILWTPPFGTVSLFKSQSNDKTLIDLIGGLSYLPKNWPITLRSHPSNPISEDLVGDKLPKNFSINNQGNVSEAVGKHDLIITQPTTAGFIAVLYKKPLLFFNNSWITQKHGDPIIDSGSALNVPLSAINKIDQYVLNLLNDKNLLKNQRLAQEKFAKEYCAYFGKESCKRIAKFAKKIIDEKAKGN